jgi:hypothetical protein
MANTNALQYRKKHGRVDPAKTDIVARGRVSAVYMHGTPLGDTSVSPLTPSSAQAMIIMQTPSASDRHSRATHFDALLLDD